MTLIDIKRGDSVTINGVSGVVCGIDHSTDRVVFIDIKVGR